MKRWLVVAALALMIPSAGAQFTDGDSGWTRTDFDFTTHDGVVLKASIWEPEGEGPFPALLTTHGWPGRHDEGNTVIHAEHFASRGYIVYSWTARGFGESGGESTLDGPNEVKDAIAILDLASQHEKIMMEAPGDPSIGMVGISYGGAVQLLTAQQLALDGDDRLDVIVPFATWQNLERSLAPNGVAKLGWVNLLYAGGVGATHGFPLGETNIYPNAEGPMMKLHEWYATIMATNEINEEIHQELGVTRSMASGLIDVPTLLIQGWPDTLFPSQEAVRNFMDLHGRGVDSRMVFYPGGHGVGGYTDFPEVNAIMDDFIDQHLLGAEPAAPPYPVVRYRPATEDYVGELQWPPAGTDYTLHYLGSNGLETTPSTFSTPLVVPPVPAQCTEVSNFQSSTSFCDYETDGTFASFSTPALSQDTEVTGTPQALVQIAPNLQQDAFLFFRLVETAADGSTTTILSQVAPWRGASNATSAYVELPTVSHTFSAGSQITLTISTTDAAFSAARETGTIELKSDATSPSVFLLPTVRAESFGDKTPPFIQPLGSFSGQGPAANSTTTLPQMSAYDDLAIANVTATSDTMVLSLASFERDGASARFTFNATRIGCGPDTVSYTVTDFTGKQDTYTQQVPACEQDTVEPEPEGEPKKEKESPTPWFFVPLALLAMLRRR